MARIRVVGSPNVIDAPLGANLLAILQAAHHPISTSCGGRATCGLCRLQVLQGRELLGPISAEEINHIGNVAKVIGLRLACRAVVISDGDLEIDVPPVVDVAARKRAQTRRVVAERASRSSLQHPAAQQVGPPGQARPQPLPTAAPSSERIEWRPRILQDSADKSDELGGQRRRRERQR
ncbi:MAG: 2Fe-2S iron-sulfur cluster-binding protein [Polyangiaceae bacterium]|jgi:2Fe-2S ferredoxin|nr:2Fe-2S iron-sulfur cluster-binding protein [Polyangiaceae bacterium]